MSDSQSTMKVGTAWDDEDQRVYVVAPPDTSEADVRAMMHQWGCDCCGEGLTVESTPTLSFLREPEGDEDEERMFPVEPDDPRANPVWSAWYDIPLADGPAPAPGQKDEPA